MTSRWCAAAPTCSRSRARTARRGASSWASISARPILVERAAFPLLLHHAIAWAARRGEAERPFARAPGEPLEAASGAVLGPGGEARTARGGFVDDTTRAGVYHVGRRAAAYSSVAVGAPVAVDAAVGAEELGVAMPPLAVLLGALLLLVMLLEWALLHRGRLA